MGNATSEIVADPILGFTYNPALPEVNSLGIREKEIAIAPPGGQKRVIVIGYSVSIMCDWEYSPDNGYVHAGLDDSVRPQFRSELLAKDRSYVLKPQSKMAELCRRHRIPLTEKGHRVLADHLLERACFGLARG